MKKIMITAGGTGGHIFPGLAVAQSFIQQGESVVWVGTVHGLETKLVPNDNIRLLTIPMQGLRGKGVVRLLKAPWLITRAVLASYKMIKQEKPDVILGMGGYVSGPVGIAARICNVPLVLHEQNAIAGMANKMLSHLASGICESFPETFPASKKVTYCGNPVRPAITTLAGKKVGNLLNTTRSLRVLILGGSQGAHAINKIIPAMVARFQAPNNIQVWHQTGAHDYEIVKEAYTKLNLQSTKIEPFIHDMATAYEWADLVVCRAGATTVAELAVIGLPAIFIPAPQAVDDHQTANANSLVKHGAAVILPQSELSCDRLFDEINQFCLKPERLTQMAINASGLGNLDATSNVVNVCRRVMK